MKRELDRNLFYKLLSTTYLILNNILENPNEEKFRKISATSAKLKNDVLDRAGGRSYLIAIGFRRKKLDDNKDYWVIENLDEEITSNLTIGREIMLEKKTQIEVENEYENKRYEEEKKKNKEREQIALLQFEEDRKNFKERQEIIPTKDSIANPFRDVNELANQRRRPNNPIGGGGDEDEVNANDNNNNNNNIPGTGHVLNPGNDDQ